MKKFQIDEEIQFYKQLRSKIRLTDWNVDFSKRARADVNIFSVCSWVRAVYDFFWLSVCPWAISFFSFGDGYETKKQVNN